MTKPDPSTMTDEEKLAAMIDSGIISDDGEDTSTDSGDDKSNKSSSDTDSKGGDDNVDHDKDGSTTTPNPVENKSEDGTPPTDDDSDKEDAGEGTHPKSSQHSERSRPLKYIPLAQYQSEKKQNEQKEQELLRQIEDLKKQNATGSTSTNQADEFVNEFAEKYGMEVEDVQKLMSKGNPSKSLEEELINLRAQNEKLEAINRLTEEKNHFNSEYSSVLPEIKSKYPHLTQEQESKLRQKLYEVAHTKEFHDKSLDYVIFKSSEVIEEIIGPQPEPQKPGRRTAEVSKPGNSSQKPLAASDFKDEASFEKLGDLADAERNKIIYDMDPKTYARFVSWAGKYDNSGVVRVNRDGKTIILK